MLSLPRLTDMATGFRALALAIFTIGLLPLALVATILPAARPAAALTVGPVDISGSAPILVNTPALLPALPIPYTSPHPTACADGSLSCVDTTISNMINRFTPLAAGCAHSAVFSLAYLRTTEEYRRAAAQPGFFADVAYVTTEDTMFAGEYFDAYDAWARGDIAQVPRAWQIAFDAADTSAVSGAGDLLLGMNAHVNRDLPYVLAALGLVTPDGASRKPDHDKVNVFLNQVVEPLLDELAARFDPSTNDLSTPLGISWTALMQILETWRESAWTNAERLVRAQTPQDWATVANQIEATAATTAATVKATYAYHPPLTSSTSRDSYCAVHHG